MPQYTSSQVMRYMTKYNKWLEWHRNNPSVYDQFVAFTNTAIALGHTRTSAWLVMNRVRWETNIVTHGDLFKISNDMIAFYARAYHANHWYRFGIFNTKQMEGEVNYVKPPSRMLTGIVP